MKKKLSIRNHRVIQSIARQFLDLMREKVATYVLLDDVDGLDRLVTQIDILTGFEVMKNLRDKGMSKEITKLCDKAGRGFREENLQ